MLYSICSGHHHNDPTRPLLDFILYFDISKTYQDNLQESVALDGGTPIPKINEVKKVNSIDV